MEAAEPARKIDVSKLESLLYFELHGQVLWAAWLVFSVILVATNRYMQGLMVERRMQIHMIAGSLCIFVYCIFSFLAQAEFDWKFKFGSPAEIAHGIFLYAFLICCLIVGIGGFWARRMMMYNKWQTKRALMCRLVHRVVAWSFVIIGFVAVATGIYVFNELKTIPEEGTEWIHMSIGFIVLAVMEITHQILLYDHVPYKVPGDAKPFTLEEFNARVARGEQLVILDDMVLDVTKFQWEHPGGTFSISQNIGNDVSKFFYGGFALENVDKLWPWTHSNDARRLVNLLVIGRLIEQAPERVMKIESAHQVSKANHTLCFVFTEDKEHYKDKKMELDKQKQLMTRHFCSIIDYRQVARHYLVMSSSHPTTKRSPSAPGTWDVDKFGIKRHYTEAFVMRQEVYGNILTVASDFTNQKAITALRRSLTQNNYDNISVTLKNYGHPKGLSRFLHEDVPNKAHSYNIQGPMGSGLDIRKRGRHVAFSAGTGVLVFIDLVAHLILRLLPEVGGPDIINQVVCQADGSEVSIIEQDYHPQADGIDLDNFQLELYTNFATEDEAIGLELIQTLKSLCEKTQRFNLFSHISRISAIKDENNVRWTEAFFFKKFRDYKQVHEEFTQIWVCTPPVVQELFEKAAGIIGRHDPDLHFHIL